MHGPQSTLIFNLTLVLVLCDQKMMMWKFWWGLFAHGVELFLIYNQALSKLGQSVEEKPELMVQNGYDFQIQHPKIS